MNYTLCITYDVLNDEFYGIVQSEKDGSVFKIENTDHMLELLEDRHMDHVDDIEGLRYYLVESGVIGVWDYISGIEVVA